MQAHRSEGTVAPIGVSSGIGSTLLDNSLTSLNWLPEFQIPNIDRLVVPKHQPPPPAPPLGDDASLLDSVFESGDEKEREEDIFIPLSPLKRCMNQTAEFEQDHWKYKNDTNKPPFSYTTIIYLAISSSRNEKVTLGEIYQWIRDHFMYYRLAESTWQNSVRHNLSLNDFFIKIPRNEGDPGKGSFWQTNPDYKNVVTNEIEFQRLEELQSSQRLFSGHKSKVKSRKKIHSTNGCSTNNSRMRDAKSKRCKSTSSVPTTSDQVYHLSGDLDWASLLGSQRMSCGSCTGVHTCQASFRSPVLGITGDEQIGCSPVIVPMSLQSRVPETPPTFTPVTLYHPILDEIMSTQESPAPLLPPWAESRSQSPNINIEHPWAESRERARHVWVGSPDSAPWIPMNGGYPPSSSTSTVQVAQLI